MFGTSGFNTPALTPLLTPLLRPSPNGFTLVHRPRHLGSNPTTEDSDGYSSDSSLSSDFESFSLTNRPKIELSPGKKRAQPSEFIHPESVKKQWLFKEPVKGIDVGPWDPAMIRAAMEAEHEH